MKTLKYLTTLLLLLAAVFTFNACGGGDGGGSSSSSDNGQGGDEEAYSVDPVEYYLPKLVGQWYFINDKYENINGSQSRVVKLQLFTLNSNMTWSLKKRYRLSSENNFKETIPGIDSEGTFTLQSNNIVATYTSGTKVNWNFSSEALNRDILKVIEKYEGSSDVDNLIYNRFKYSSEEDCLNAYVASMVGSGGGGGSSYDDDDTETPGGNVDVQGKVQGTLKAYGTEYSSVARYANGQTTVVDYVYYASTGKYYVYGGAWCSAPNGNGGKGIRYDAKKGYNSILINSGATYDSSTKSKHNWEVYLQVTLP